MAAGTAIRETQESAEGRVKRWLLEGMHPGSVEGPHEKEEATAHHEHPWWKVMCLTGVDYFSTLGYQPGIAALAAGTLSPVATLILVLLTLFGALPIYNRVAAESPHGEGSIAMLERLMNWWKGKLFVLALLGFVATDFIITITLSAADATAHIVENPYGHALHGQEIGVTLFLIALLAGVFLKGFKEAIGIAVGLVFIYLGLNAVVVGIGLYHVAMHGTMVGDWWSAMLQSRGGNPFLVVAAALMVFPKLALGLSGFETGVAVMPLVKGDPGDTHENPAGRVRNTCKLLLSAALIMSVFLISSSLVTTLLIPSAEFQTGGKANGRALAYLAHEYLGNGFGTVYDLSTILILWFAGASAMAGLLNIVPRYLPRYGMAPEWTRAARPLVIAYFLIAVAVTIIFKANVEAQGGAYATGVLVLMSSAAVAVTISAWQRGQRRGTVAFGLITLVFAYTTIVNIIERPDGIKIASFFIGAIIVISFMSRIWRATELRVERVELDSIAWQFLKEIAQQGEIRIIANKRQEGDATEYYLKEQKQREGSHIPPNAPILFLEVEVADASEFTDVVTVEGIESQAIKLRDPSDETVPYTYRILRACGSSVPNSIAALLLHIRDTHGKRPHVYFSWSEGSPLMFLMRFLLFGEGDTAPVTHEILRRAEPDPLRRPAAHVAD
jgi:hypothetical protein